MQLQNNKLVIKRLILIYIYIDKLEYIIKKKDELEKCTNNKKYFQKIYQLLKLNTLVS